MSSEAPTREEIAWLVRNMRDLGLDVQGVSLPPGGSIVVTVVLPRARPVTTPTA
jgi:hypothetical protein